MFTTSPDRVDKSIALASLGLSAGFVHSLLRQQFASAFAVFVGIAAISGFAVFH
ncbi:MAG TPA: hypothetical protein VEK35_01260 [Roseiarcus sp.]|nr:hypothetical protein [Roseiarcus sp.]